MSENIDDSYESDGDVLTPETHIDNEAMYSASGARLRSSYPFSEGSNEVLTDQEKAALLTKEMFMDWLVANQIWGFAVDLDDTLTRTSNVYYEAFYDVAREILNTADPSVMSFHKDIVAYLEGDIELTAGNQVDKEIQTPEDLIVSILSRINTERHKDLGIVRERWGIVLDDFLDEIFLEIGEEFRNHFKEYALERMEKVYWTPPEICPGVEKFLCLLNEIGCSYAVVTHADEAQTRVKVERTELANYFDMDSVWMANIELVKSSSDWLEGFAIINSKYGFWLDPSDLGIIGDNLNGDIHEAHAAGVPYKNMFYIRSPFSVYRKGEVPDDVNRIESIEDLLAKIYDWNVGR